MKGCMLAGMWGGARGASGYGRYTIQQPQETKKDEPEIECVRSGPASRCAAWAKRSPFSTSFKAFLHARSPCSRPARGYSSAKLVRERGDGSEVMHGVARSSMTRIT